MRHYSNTRLITRNRWTARILLYSGFAMLVAAFVLSLARPEQFAVLLYLAALGFVVSQLGTSLNNRWGRSPRMDQVLDDALKGLDERYAIVHYALGTSHALLTPNGGFALIPRLDAGEIGYEDGVWWQEGGRRFLRRAGRRPLRGLEVEAYRESSRLESVLRKKGFKGEAISTQPMLVFLNPGARLAGSASSYPATHVKKLKALIRKLPKAHGFESWHLDRIEATLGGAQ